MQVVIRNIKLEDNARVEKVIRTVLEEHGITHEGTAYCDESLKTMYEFYTADKSAYFVALLDGKIVGGAGIYPSAGLPDNTCELVKMYILPEVRGIGLGKKLLDHCIDFAYELGYSKIYLETVPEFKSAISMYEKSGFVLLDGPLGNTGHFACGIRMLK
ncbi:MAG TPA: GNAT family N-acetyltransferase [Flavobacteriales bacterium]|nr:GNAT family N-acetyltransferase [Flavobacteriales bacterium]